MILLDENIPEDQSQLLRSWRIRVRQIGQDFGRQGMHDEQQILPLLHKLDRPPFVTRDLGFFDQRITHERYALVCLAVSQNDVARFVRRLLRHSEFKTKTKRMGSIVRVGPTDLRIWRIHAKHAEKVDWIET